MAPGAAQIQGLAARQFDVVRRGQLLAIGATGRWIDHRVSSGRWQRVFPGVYAVHSGPLPWRTRAAAALAHAGSGAALSHRSAGYLHEFAPEPPGVIEVSVDHRRRVDPQARLRIYRRRGVPPSRGRLRAVDRAETAVDLAEAAQTADDVVGILCAAVRAGTWPEEIMGVLALRARVRGRALLVELLSEVAEGVESPLERRYCHHVERRHGLPRATLQVRQRIGGRWIRADALYAGLGVRTELDGALAHPEGRTDRDTWRDNSVLIAHGEITLRYRWSHVVGSPCDVARQVEQALRSRGWPGRARACGPACPVARD